MESAMPMKEKYQVGKVQAGLLLTVGTLLYLLNYADRAVLSAVLEPMKIALNLTDAELGIVQSVFNVGVAILAIPMSFLVDRWSRRKSLGLMAIVWSIATFATGLSSKFIHLLAARSAVGVGEAGYTVGAIGWLSVVFPKGRKGLVQGIFGIGSVVGTVGGLVLAGYIATKTGDWRTPFIYFAIPGLLLAIPVFFFKDYANVRARNERAFNRKYFADWILLFKRKSYTLTVIGQTLFGFFYFTYIGFMPALLMRAYGLDAHNATLIVGGAALLALIGGPLGGWVADKWLAHNKGARPLVMGIAMLTLFLSAGAVFVTLGVAMPILIALIAISALATSIIQPVSQAIFTDILPLSHRMTGNGLLVSIMYLGNALGPWVVGLVSDTYGSGAIGLKTGFLFIVPAVLISSIIWFVNTRFYIADSARVSDEALAE